MKDIESKPEPTVSYAALLEKIEILRSALRWAQNLDRPQIQKLLDQCNVLRDEALRLSHPNALFVPRVLPRNQSVEQRRKALEDRDFQFDGVFGDSPRLIEALEIAEKAAPTDLPVLIDGESGTGKELMAKVIHANGSRAERRLYHGELRSHPGGLARIRAVRPQARRLHRRDRDRAGKFESANGGTIFLDEIGELPLMARSSCCACCSRARSSASAPTRPSASTHASSQRPTRTCCRCARSGTFREDLYYRLSIIQVTLPPLRERRDEIPMLIDYFANEAAER